MKYVIADKVIYDTASGLLTVIGAEDGDDKKLTNTANRILGLLVGARGEVLERAFLLEAVWESVGHTGSSASLNQYISILRKTLTSLIDIEETIIAVPKVGFLLSPDIDVRPCPEDNDGEPSSTDDADALSVADNAAGRGTSARHKGRILWLNIVLGCIVLALIGGCIWQYKNDGDAYHFDRVYGLPALNSCTVQAYDELSAELKEQTIDLLLRQEPGLTARCKKQPAVVTVQIQRSLYFGSRGRLFYAYCPVDSKTGDVMYCESHYVFNWDAK